MKRNIVNCDKYFTFNVPTCSLFLIKSLTRDKGMQRFNALAFSIYESQKIDMFQHRLVMEYQ